MRHGGSEHEDSFEHGRSKVTPTPWDFPPIPDVARNGGRIEKSGSIFVDVRKWRNFRGTKVYDGE